MKRTRIITFVGVLSALAAVLQFFEFPLVMLFPSYLKIDFSDIPAILGAIALGPLVGVAIEFVKNLIHFIFASNSPFASGEIANFFAGIGLLIPVAVMYRKNIKKFFLPYIVGAISMTVVANIMNYFVNLPLYGLKKEALWPTIINFLVPFNLVKAAIVAVVTIILYSKLKTLLNRISA